MASDGVYAAREPPDASLPPGVRWTESTVGRKPARAGHPEAQQHPAEPHRHPVPRPGAAPGEADESGHADVGERDRAEAPPISGIEE
ncbi:MULTISPECIES: hypothetical protein [unclassified Anaeromyxobacter]|uniref:hypothetical protein n=1 Tax=unclassified Anaeromyxobacter TaxID=2620896 RepID=UPI001F5AB439|nr:MULTISPECIES: hypothetical protein [unclassified Anaeromyxobacter]